MSNTRGERKARRPSEEEATANRRVEVGEGNYDKDWGAGGASGREE